MIRKALGSKWLITATGAGVVALLVIAAAVVVQARTHTVSYCAVMTDGVGMYKGNSVTRRGVKVGVVTSVQSKADTAVVHFNIDSDQSLPTDISAVSVAPSVIAVRQLALLGDYAGGPKFTAGQCVPISRTATPVTITKALESAATVSRQLTTGGGPEQYQQVIAAVNTLNTELAGAGPVINSMLKQLAKPGKSPITGAVSDMATVLDNVSSMSTGIVGNWSLAKELIPTLEPLLNGGITADVSSVSNIVDDANVIVDAAQNLVPKYLKYIWPVLDAVVPIARIVGSGARNYGDLLGIVPSLIRAFKISFDQKSLGLKISYVPPSTRMPAKNPQLTCANINRYFPGQCKVLDAQTMDIDAVRAVLLLTGAAR